jgi:hypothetical protein
MLIMEKELKQKIKEYMDSLSDSNINIQSEFARDMITKDIMNIVILYVSDWKPSNEY